MAKQTVNPGNSPGFLFIALFILHLNYGPELYFAQILHTFDGTIKTYALCQNQSNLN